MFLFVANHYYFMLTAQERIKVTCLCFFYPHVVLMRQFLVRLSSRVRDDLFCVLGLNILAELLRLCLIKPGLVEQMPEGVSRPYGASANNRNFPSLHNSSTEKNYHRRFMLICFLFFGRFVHLKCLITSKSFI